LKVKKWVSQKSWSRDVVESWYRVAMSSRDVVESQYPPLLVWVSDAVYVCGWILTSQCCLQPQDVRNLLQLRSLVLGAPGPVFLHGQLCYGGGTAPGTKWKRRWVEVSVMDTTVSRNTLNHLFSLLVHSRKY
jgi:hypothetical protein